MNKFIKRTILIDQKNSYIKNQLILMFLSRFSITENNLKLFNFNNYIEFSPPSVHLFQI